jgi:hypothetical protein
VLTALMIPVAVPSSVAAVAEARPPATVSVEQSARSCPLWWPRPLRDMSGFRRSGIECLWTEWALKGTVPGHATAQSVLRAYDNQLRLGVYFRSGAVECGRTGSTRYCLRPIQMLNPPPGLLVTGEIRATVGPLRADGLRNARLDVVVGLPG